MNLLRKILFPFSAIYGAITHLRNYLYNNGVLKSYKFDIPVIVVGNLNVGGTGKTPQVEYLIRLLAGKYKVATLSRGYKRKTKGFVLANQYSNAQILGDEPYQFYSKFPNIRVAVDGNRVRGINNLLQLDNPPEIVLLDDAFQHRRVQADFYILLTTFSDLYVADFILPTGNLRESRSGAKRANIIVVTKCPPNITFEDREEILRKIKPLDNQLVFFSITEYDENVYNDSGSLARKSIKLQSKFVLAGIANPKPFFETLHHKDDIVLEFPDHHNFSEKDILKISENLGDKLIITTEKDYVRLKNRLPDAQLYYLPIKSTILDESKKFNEAILQLVDSKLT